MIAKDIQRNSFKSRVSAYFSRKNWSWRKNKKRLTTLLMLIPIMMMLFPLYLIVNNSFKTLRQMYYNALAFPNPPTLENYGLVLEKVNYFRQILNNFIIAIPSLVIIVVVGAMAGFVIARRPSRWTKILYIYIIMGIALPTFTIIYPQVKLIFTLGLNNNYLGLILLYSGAGMSMSIFLFNGFFGSAPRDLEESAKIDGASFVRIFFQIYFPLSIATIATLVMLQSISIWNDTTLPNLVMVEKSRRTLMSSLNEFYGAMVGQGIRWEQIYAYSVLCMLPMFLMFFGVNRYLIDGVAEGALKG